MKNGLKFLVVLPIVFLTAGCGAEKKEVVNHCVLTSTSTTQGYSVNSTYDVYSKNNVVSKVVTEEVVESDNESVLSYFEKYLKETYESQNETYGGTTNKVTNENGKVTSSTTIDYSKMDLDKFVKSNTALSSYVNDKNQLTKDGVISLYESLGAKCE